MPAAAPSSARMFGWVVLLVNLVATGLLFFTPGKAWFQRRS